MIRGQVNQTIHCATATAAFYRGDLALNHQLLKL